jgi:hypothetical protein
MSKGGKTWQAWIGQRTGGLILMMAILLGLADDGGRGFADSMDNRSVDQGFALYEQGRGIGGREIQGTLGNGVEVRGAAVACANCHGRDGRGLAEGGLRAPDIRWSVLSDRYAPVRRGLVAVPYDRSRLRHTLMTGRRPDGTLLDPAMPRFELTEGEVSALVDRLIALSSTASSAPLTRPVILGLAPEAGRDRTADQFIRIIEQCPETMRPHPIASIRWIRYRDPAEALGRLEEIHAREAALLLVAPYIVGWEDRFAEWAESRSPTVVLPFAFWNPRGSAGWLYRLPGVERQVERLIEAAAHRGAAAVTLAVDLQDRLSLHLEAVAEQMAKTVGLPLERGIVQRPTYPHRPEWALLWLRPMREIERFVSPEAPHRVLIPSLFYDPSSVPKRGRWRKTEWIVAYPYNPQELSSGHWIAPATLWGLAACRILASLAEGVEENPVLSRPLTLAPFPLILSPRHTDDEARAMVGLVTNPRGYAR